MTVSGKIFGINDNGEKPMQGALKVFNPIWKLSEETLVEVHKVHEDIMTDENRTLFLQRSLQLHELFSYSLLAAFNVY